MFKLIDELKDKYSTIILAYPTGSYYICDPPVENTDKDIVCYCRDLDGVKKTLIADGWKECAPEQYDNIEWVAVRKDDVNLIIHEKLSRYNRFVYSTNIAKELNLRKKEDRVSLFELLRKFPYDEV